MSRRRALRGRLAISLSQALTEAAGAD